MKYLFNHWAAIKAILAKRYIMLFCDYDGTLAPIVDRPEKAQISKKTKILLGELSKSSRCKVAIISGRALEDINSRVGVKNIIYAGNHGFEIKGPKIRLRKPVPSTSRRALGRVKDELARRFSSINGILIDDKAISLSIHYRLVPKKKHPLVRSIIYKTIAMFGVRGNVRLKKGKMVFELRPAVDWDKGAAVLWLLARQRRKVLPIYIGDDSTDEDAFEALKGRGMTIFVGKARRSRAEYYLRNADEVVKFLGDILELRRADIWRN